MFIEKKDFLNATVLYSKELDKHYIPVNILEWQQSIPLLIFDMPFKEGASMTYLFNYNDIEDDLL